MDRNLRLSILLKAGGNALGFLRGVKTESDRTSTALNSAREKVQALQRTTKDVGAFRQMEARLQGTRGALEAAQVEAKRLALANAAAERPTRQMARAFEVARTKVRELQAQEQKQVSTLQDLRGKLESAGVSTRNLAGHEVRLAREIRDANKAMTDQARRMDAIKDRQARMGAARGRYDKTQQLAGTMQGAGASALAGGVVTAAPLIGAGSAGMAFEDGMADISKVVDFPTPAAFRQMGQDILSLSTRIPVATEGLTAIVAAAGQAGIARGELMGFAEDAGKMGIAFDTTADDAGAKMATWRTAFRMTQTEVRGLADQINYLGNNGPANALSISNVVTRIGPLGEVAGLAAGQIAALGSTIVGMGVEEEIAATGIKNTMLALTKGTAATKSQKAAYAALGLEASDMAKRMQTDAGGAIIDVMSQISKLSGDQQTAVLTQLFGSESVSAIAPLLTNLDLLKTNLNRVGDATLYAGSMQKEYEGRAATTSNAVLLMKHGIKAVAIEVGTAFLPQIKQGAAFLGDMAQKVHTFAQAHPGAVRAIGMLVAVIATGLVVFGGLAMAVAAVLGPFALLQLTLTQTGLLFGPAGVKIAEFAGRNLPSLGRALGTAGRAVVGFAGKALPMIGRGLLLAGRGFLTFGAMAGRAGLMLLANPITWIVLGIVAAVALLAGAAYLIYRNWGTLGPWIAGIWQGIKTGVSNAIGFMSRVFMNFSPVGLLIGAVMRAWPALQALGSRFLEMGRHLLTGLVNGVLGGIPALVAAVMRAGGAVVTAFKNKLGIHSPSRVFAQLGDYTMQGLGIGLGRSARDPLRRMRTAATAITAAGAMAIGGSAMTAPTFDTAPALGARRPAPALAAAPPVTIGTLHLQIVQNPGEDMEALAQRVAELLKNPTNGASFSDDDSYGEAP
ncbi:phage tail tape measure protein [uncultured Brevundimonas sp.]|uniref:phage tail tape measure protein n=1 Tax=uncultured Brevundimonas sp. TaxID=213418 RepID=UPI0025FF3233|nr:phage tail tape measure protein [uncultured Brevundimonas sp.]